MSRSELEVISESTQSETKETALAVYYHTHWDREWYLPFRAYQVRLAEVVDDILERLDQNVLPCFMLDGQTVVLEDYLELRPDKREALQGYVRAGTLSIGPWFVMPDEFLVGGESLIRNLVRGIRESRAWGCDRFTGYLPDTFGHSADMATLLSQCGIDSAVVWRGINPQKSLFRWQSPSGAMVKTLHLTDGYFQMMLQDWTATETQQVQALQGLVQKLQAAQSKGHPVLMPMGGDHLGPLPKAAYNLLKQHYPNLLETTPDRYLADLNGIEGLGIVSGELVDQSGSFLLPGVYSSRMYLKQANRRLEHFLTRKLEPLLAMSQVFLASKPQRYPAPELDVAWKTLILNHPHDSICGCSVDEVHRENEVRFDQVTQLGEALLNRVQQSCLAALATDSEWLVLNTAEAPFTGVVYAKTAIMDPDEATGLMQSQSQSNVLQDAFLHDSQRIPLSHLTQIQCEGWLWVENVPAFGYQVVSKNAKGKELPPHPVVGQENLLENENLRVTVNLEGTLTVEDKRTGQRFPNLLTFKTQPDHGDSYNSGPVPGSQSDFAMLIAHRLLQSGPLVAALELTHRCLESNRLLTTRVELRASESLLRFETTFVNEVRNCKLQVVFETSGPVSCVQAESHFSVIERTYDPTYREVDFVPVEKMKELKTNTGPIQRFFSANGQSWITEGLAEYEVYGPDVALTLMRAFNAISSGETGVRGAQAGPPFETPEGQCLNRTFQCRYAWLPTPNEPYSLYQAAQRFYGTVWAESGSNRAKTASNASGSMLWWDQPALVLSACYWVSGRGLVVRLINTCQQPVTSALKVGFDYKTLHQVNFLEEPVGVLKTPAVTIPPWGVQTLLFEV